ncbi:MAG: chemotaxis protein CheW [Polyangiaceae bacterium]|nr:chemotaxis protein CheW [Polyangiaceae bacterium]
MSNQDLSEGDDLAAIFEQRARELARPASLSKTSTGTPHLCFVVAGARFALELPAVYTVVRPPWLTRIPCTPAHLERAFSHRGRIIGVLDIAHLLRLDRPMERSGSPARIVNGARAGERSGTIIVLAEPAAGLGIEPTRLDGVAGIDLSRLDTASSETDFGLIRGIAPDLTLVLSAEQLANRVRSLAAASQKPSESRA